MGMMMVDVDLVPGREVAVETGAFDIVGITLSVGYILLNELLLNVIAGMIPLSGVPIGVTKSCLTTLAV